MLGFLLWSSHGSNFRYFLKRYIGALGPQIVCPDVLCDLEQPRRKRSEEHTSEPQSQSNLVCRLLLEKKKNHLYNGVNRDASPLIDEGIPVIHNHVSNVHCLHILASCRIELLRRAVALVVSRRQHLAR